MRFGGEQWVLQLTRHGSGRLKTAGAEFKAMCRRILPLAAIPDRPLRTLNSLLEASSNPQA